MYWCSEGVPLASGVLDHFFIGWKAGGEERRAELWFIQEQDTAEYDIFSLQQAPLSTIVGSGFRFLVTLGDLIPHIDIMMITYHPYLT